MKMERANAVNINASKWKGNENKTCGDGRGRIVVGVRKKSTFSEQNIRRVKIMWNFICCYCNEDGFGWLNRVCSFLYCCYCCSPLAIVSQFFVVHLAVAFFEIQFFSLSMNATTFSIYSHKTTAFNAFFLPITAFCALLAIPFWRLSPFANVNASSLLYIQFYLNFHCLFFLLSKPTHQHTHGEKENKSTQWISKTNLCLTNALNFRSSPLFFLVPFTSLSLSALPCVLFFINVFVTFYEFIFSGFVPCVWFVLVVVWRIFSVLCDFSWFDNGKLF